MEEDIQYSGVKKKAVGECVLDKTEKNCIKHECGVRVISVSTKKWRYKPKKKEYGYVNVKVKKIICSGARDGRVSDSLTHVGPTSLDSANSTTVQGGPTVVKGGGGGNQTIEHVGHNVGGRD